MPESIQEAAQALSNTEIVNNWVADGTPAAEPITTETPAEQPRGPDGKFIAASEAPPAAPTDTPTQAPVATEPVAVPPAGASAQQVAEFIAAKQGEADFQLPKGIRLPLKRGETVEYVPVEDLMAGGMRERDYRLKTAELGQQRRETEAAAARVAAREQWLAEQDAEMREAQKDPAKWEAYQETLRLYETNPLFRQRMDEALEAREVKAENEVYRQRDFEAVKQQGIEMARSWIADLATEFPGVNPDRVRLQYADALKAGAQLDPAVVRAIYQREAGYVQQVTGPLATQLADLKAQIAAIQASKAAETHNATTQHAVARGRTPPVATTGSPAAPALPAPGERFGMRELPDRNSAWAKQR